MELRATIRTVAVAAIVVFSAACAIAAPADIARAVAEKDRPAEAVKLDDGRQPVKVLTFLGLRRGDRALDLMPGAGYYTEIMADAVGPKGSVVAVEPPQFIADDKSKAAWAALRKRAPNALLQEQTPKDLVLAPASFDFALLHLVYHDLYWESEKYKFPRHDPDAVLASLSKAMKPGGTVGVVDHVGPAGTDTRTLVEKAHRIDPAVVRADFERAGFVLDGESDVLRNIADDKAKSVFDAAVRGKTDRIVYRFRKRTEEEPTMGACNADKVQHLIGKAMSDALGVQAQRESGARALRVYTTGSPVTMDYSPDRLNIESDAAGKIVRLNCG